MTYLKTSYLVALLLAFSACGYIEDHYFPGGDIHRMLENMPHESLCYALDDESWRAPWLQDMIEEEFEKRDLSPFECVSSYD